MTYNQERVLKNVGYRKERLSFARRAVIASASVTSRKNTIHCFGEPDISRPRQLIREYERLSGQRLSFTAYVVTCLAQTIKKHPHLNSFVSRRHIIHLPSVTVSVLIEREIDGAAVPEPLAIENCENKSHVEVHDAIRHAQENKDNRLGGLSDNRWIRLIPTALLKAFVRIADKNARMGVRYGKVAVTAVGMFSKEAIWFVPHGSPTVLVSVGSITDKVIEVNGKTEQREHLCITVSFDHDIVDGAPAARFMSDFLEEIKSGRLIVPD